MEQLILPVVFVVTGLILVGVGLPMKRRRVKPNGWYGVRLRSTREDETIWYDVNEKAGRELVVLGVCVVLLTAIGSVVSEAVLVNALVATSVLLVGTILVAVRSMTLARRLWRERHPVEGAPS